MDNDQNTIAEHSITEINTATAEMILNPDPRGEGHPDNDNIEDEDEEETVMDELTAEEYASVDRALDEVLTFMDVLEERSDDLFAKMQEFLADSRQTRIEMQTARERDDDVQAKSNSEDPPP